MSDAMLASEAESSHIHETYASLQRLNDESQSTLTKAL